MHVRADDEKPQKPNNDNQKQGKMIFQNFGATIFERKPQLFERKPQPTWFVFGAIEYPAGESSKPPLRHNVCWHRKVKTLTTRNLKNRVSHVRWLCWQCNMPVEGAAANDTAKTSFKSSVEQCYHWWQMHAGESRWEWIYEGLDLNVTLPEVMFAFVINIDEVPTMAEFLHCILSSLRLPEGLGSGAPLVHQSALVVSQGIIVPQSRRLCTSRGGRWGKDAVEWPRRALHRGAGNVDAFDIFMQAKSATPAAVHRQDNLQAQGSDEAGDFAEDGEMAEESEQDDDSDVLLEFDNPLQSQRIRADNEEGDHGKVDEVDTDLLVSQQLCRDFLDLLDVAEQGAVLAQSTDPATPAAEAEQDGSFLLPKTSANSTQTPGHKETETDEAKATPINFRETQTTPNSETVRMLEACGGRNRSWEQTQQTSKNVVLWAHEYADVESQ